MDGQILASLLCHPQRHLGNAIEVDIVLTDKLENAGFLVAPVLLPFIIRQAFSLEISLGERDRCP